MNVTTGVNENTGGMDYLRTGIAEFKVIAINPSRNELNKLLGREAKDTDKEIEYLSEKDGKDKVKIVYWVEDIISGWKNKLEFDITNEEALTKNGNNIWVNVCGDNAKVAKENLQKWFMEFYKSKDDKTVIGEKNFRKAKVGEAPLYEFFKSWMYQYKQGRHMDYYDPACDILLDMKKLFRGNWSEITDIWKRPEEENITNTVTLAAYVESYEKEGKIKYAQKIWPYKTAPGQLMKKINVAIATDSWEASADTKKFKSELTGEYGIKQGFQLGNLKTFDPSEHLEATNQVIKHTETTPDPDPTGGW